MQFIRIIQHLLPMSPVWRLTFNKTLRKFFEGLAMGFDNPDPIVSPKAFADAIFFDIFPSTTRQRDKWLTQFGLERGADSTADILQLTAAWQAQGGQDPHYLQSTLQAAGFPLYVHGWWQEGVAPFAQVCAGDTLAQAGEPLAMASPRSFRRFVRDPRLYTNVPATGSVQASALADQPQASDLVDQPQANAFLTNEPGYLVNGDLSHNAPPAIPDDSELDWPTHWPYVFYLGGANFPDRVAVPASRRAELERLVLKLKPTHLWVVMLVDYISPLVGSDGVQLVNDHGEELNVG